MKFLHQSNSIHYFENSNDKIQVALQNNSAQLLKKQLSSSWYYMKDYENEIQNKKRLNKRKDKQRDLLTKTWTFQPE